jgi:hypothetical protein
VRIHPRWKKLDLALLADVHPHEVPAMLAGPSWRYSYGGLMSSNNNLTVCVAPRKLKQP